MTGALDGRVGAFHGFYGDAGGFGDNHCLSDIVLRQVTGDCASIADVLLLLFGGRALGEDAGPCKERLEEGCRVLQDDAFVGEDLCQGAEQGIGVARAQRKQQLRQTPVGLDIGEDLLVFHLSRHDGAAHTFALESVDELGEFAEG